ncbi:SgcJ/EcaC family oxidoreductase [Phenylobacterium zucineum]|uniref:SgcJ/EcaC family oxidoreductase n=1 Tax=Phenylobacterium zucineum TaxID=284016 RepID=UPI00030DB3A0|nr:SgcJ/EcaC family oxidoreductase [Phenylobacterium zucineum]
MKPLPVLAALAAVALTAQAHAAPPSHADAVALRLLSVDADRAWNAADADAMAAHYAPDASLLVGAAGGRTSRGRDEIRAYFARAFGTRAGVMRHVSELKGMEALSPDLVLNDLEVRVEERQADGTWKLVRRFDNLSLAVRAEGGWKLRAVRAYPAD